VGRPRIVPSRFFSVNTPEPKERPLLPGKPAVAEFGADACTVREAKGYGRQKGYLDRYKGSEYSTAYLPKVEVCVWVEDERYDELARIVAKAARTGRIGDGKVFVYSLDGEIEMDRKRVDEPAA
jgi:nitrogen regulatory protein PII